LFDEVFVRNLSEASAFISVKVDIVNIERCSRKRRNNEIASAPSAACGITKFDVNLDFVVLKSNKGKSKTGVSAEPELKGNV